MLRLYLDDAGSQTNDQKPIFAVGGYVAPVDVWDSFSVVWQRVLNEMKSPPYHATDCEPGPNGCGHGEFSDWNTNKLLELKSRLAPLTLQLSAGVGRVLIVPEHNEYLLKEPVLVNRIQGAREYLPLFLLLETVLDWIAYGWPDKPEGDEIEVIFETGTKGLALATNVFRWLRENMSWASNTYTEELGFGDKILPPLQAADMLAFSAYKDIEGRLCTPPRVERKILTVLRQHGRLSFKGVAVDDYPIIR